MTQAPGTSQTNHMRTVQVADPDQKPQDLGQNTFSNPIIVRTVLSYSSDYHHLLTSCRLVNKLWEEEATRELLSCRHKTRQTVHFKWDNNSHSFHGTRRHSPGGLAEFHKNVWTRSRKFPVSQFGFVIGDLGSPDSSAFFSEAGRHINSLAIKLVDSPRPTAISTFRQLFLDWLPNLENLTITEPQRGSHWTDHPENSLFFCPGQDHSFPHLETLRIFEYLYPGNESQTAGNALKMSTSRMICDIYMNAPNLKLIPSMVMSYPEEMMSTVPFQRVESIHWKISKENFRAFDRMTEVEQKLKHLHLDLRDHRQLRLEFFILTQRALNRLLTASSHTLINLRMDEGLQVLPLIQLPAFEKVQSLHMTYSPSFRTPGMEMGKSGHILPARYRLDQVFPNLASLAILGDGRHSYSFWSTADQPHGYGHLFSRPENSSHTVTCLFLCPMYKLPITDEIFTSVNVSYPTLGKLALDIKDVAVLLPLLPAIWRHLSHLKDLAVHLDLGLFFSIYVNDEDDWISQADSAITGIPLEHCKILLKSQSVEVDPEFYQTQPRETPSILNMTELKMLCIVDISLERNLIYSDVTRRYGIEPMVERQQMEFFTEFYRSNPTIRSFCLFENCPICRSCVYEQ